MGQGVNGVTISRPGVSGYSRLAWSQIFRDSNIYRLELPGQPEDPPAKPATPQVWIASSFRDVFPQYSPNGKAIAFYPRAPGGRRSGSATQMEPPSSN